jgi:hypothetical protein
MTKDDDEGVIDRKEPLIQFLCQCSPLGTQQGEKVTPIHMKYVMEKSGISGIWAI